MFYHIAKGILIPIFRLLYGIKVVGLEKIPKNEPLIFAANHKSLLDPLFVGLFVPPTVHYMAKKELFENKFLNWLFRNLNVFPVSRDKADISTIKLTLKILKEGDCIGIFPQGTRIFGNDIGKAKPGTAMFSIKGQAKVMPVSIISQYKYFKKTLIYIDNPISFEEYYGKKLGTSEYENLSQIVLDTIDKNIRKNGEI